MTKSDLLRLEQPALTKLIEDDILVEVVRCGKCNLKKYCRVYEDYFDDNDFCSCGEKERA